MILAANLVFFLKSAKILHSFFLQTFTLGGRRVKLFYRKKGLKISQLDFLKNLTRKIFFPN